MNRIMIIGCCGSGKSTLAQKMHHITSIPLYHLDQYYWQPNWTETPKDEWKIIVEELAEKENWIIDGNYGGTMDIRFEHADTIVYMDYSTIKCLGRVVKRTFKYKGQVRPDMPEGCKERFDFDFLHYVATYNLIRRKSILKKLTDLKNTKKIIRIRSEKDEDILLANLKKQFK